MGGTVLIWEEAFLFFDLFPNCYDARCYTSLFVCLRNLSVGRNVEAGRLVLFSTDPFDRYEGDESFFFFFLSLCPVVGRGGRCKLISSRCHGPSFCPLCIFFSYLFLELR